jgi:hypothetical protein
MGLQVLPSVIEKRMHECMNPSKFHSLSIELLNFTNMQPDQMCKNYCNVASITLVNSIHWKSPELNLDNNFGITGTDFLQNLQLTSLSKNLI